jgi:hypothetical protein
LIHEPEQSNLDRFASQKDNPTLFETKKNEENIIPSQIIENSSSSDNSFYNDEDTDNFKTISIEKNSRIS